ncbi:MAG: c-type cytochrome [Mariniblastus sp.]
MNRRSLFSVVASSMFALQALLVGPLVLGQAGSADKLQLPEGFTAELLYSVPKEQGSWVSITTDPKGRLITSDQYGKLYRVTPNGGEVSVEPIELNIGRAQGLLCAFDSLYVVSTGGDKKEKRTPGLYRVRDTDGDDKYDSVEKLREFKGSSEHGPHAVVLGPEKKSIYVCAGNHTLLPNPETSRVPLNWKEDQVITRLPDANGHAVGKMAPGGWICKTDPDGKTFETISSGYRNQYDIAFDPNGELFTYDADMEYDVGLPWYRPTRVCHAVSGSEFGWRHGSGKWPEFYPDSVPPVINIGPGSPTGIVFGTGAKFPGKYQNALFISDWSYGMIYAVHMEADGTSFKATKEKFCSAPALPVTDLVVNKTDGAMYFLIGGRRSQSGLYRVTYTGDASTAAVEYPAATNDVAIRHKLESFHRPGEIEMDFVWENLGRRDRFLRYAARIALEHQPVETWAPRVFAESDPQKILEGITGVVRCGTEAHQKEVAATLAQLDWTSLTQMQKLHLIRNFGLVSSRMGGMLDETKLLITKLESHFPTGDETVDGELARLFVAAQLPAATAKIVEQLIQPSTQEVQINYALALSDAKTGWTQELREKYYQWFLDSQKTRGGRSLSGYVLNIRKHSLASLTAEEKAGLAGILNKKAETVDPYADLKSRPFVKKWTLDDLLPMKDEELKGRDIENGKKIFAIATCYKCHRISGQGGIVGPDLTPAGHRFSTKDLLETVIDPNKEISDQYSATIFLLENGKTVTGRVANLNGDRYMVQEDMIDPGKFTNVKVDQIDEMRPSKVSMMPSGLFDNLTREEIMDLVAYLKSTVDEK